MFVIADVGYLIGTLLISSLRLAENDYNISVELSERSEQHTRRRLSVRFVTLRGQTVKWKLFNPFVRLSCLLHILKWIDR